MFNVSQFSHENFLGDRDVVCDRVAMHHDQNGYGNVGIRDLDVVRDKVAMHHN